MWTLNDSGLQIENWNENCMLIINLYYISACDTLFAFVVFCVCVCVRVFRTEDFVAYPFVVYVCVFSGQIREKKTRNSAEEKNIYIYILFVYIFNFLVAPTNRHHKTSIYKCICTLYGYVQHICIMDSFTYFRMFQIFLLLNAHTSCLLGWCFLFLWFCLVFILFCTYVYIHRPVKPYMTWTLCKGYVYIYVNTLKVGTFFIFHLPN